MKKSHHHHLKKKLSIPFTFRISLPYPIPRFPLLTLFRGIQIPQKKTAKLEARCNCATKTTTKKMVIFSPKKWGVFGFWCCVLAFAICAGARSDKETRERFYGNMVNSSSPESNDGSLAKMFDRVLEKEFSENDQPEGFFFFLYIYIFKSGFPIFHF